MKKQLHEELKAFLIELGMKEGYKARTLGLPCPKSEEREIADEKPVWLKI